MQFADLLSLSWKNIRMNKLRTSITVIIIALGIFALILIITAIQAASNSLTSSFSTMGSNAFSIRYKERNMGFSNRSRSKATHTTQKEVRNRNATLGIPITLDEARLFADRYVFAGSVVGIALRGPVSVVINSPFRKTNPDVNVFGGDESYLLLNGYNLAAGRNISHTEVQSGAPVCLLGAGVAKKLYGNQPMAAIDRLVRVDHVPFRVVGVLEEKNSSAFFNTSKIVIVSHVAVRNYFKAEGSSYNIAVKVDHLRNMDLAIGEAKSVFRSIRKLTVKDADNFYMDKSDSIAATLLNNLGFLEIGTIGIAFITLIGAAIGLMNIMLVAVNERTKEIGLSKALGARSSSIRTMFLIESVLISLMGAVLGILSGVLLGNGVALFLHTGLVIPWGWVTAGIFVCFGVGLVAGLFPAVKAAKLDPIVALRYE
ncbi:MAG: ABC transporter permease [Ferruginibacter sp.]